MSSWSYRGTNLSDLGFVTQVFDSFKSAQKRGKNMEIPFEDGEVFVKKFFKPRTLMLGLEIVESTIQALEEKMDTVKLLLGDDDLGTLTQTLENGSVRSAQAECMCDFNVARPSPVSVKLTLDFVIPKSFFFSSVLTTDTQTINVSPKTYTLNNPGTARKRNPKITLTGPLTNVEITNTSTDVLVKYNGVIAGGDTVILDINVDTGEYTATHSVSGNVIGNVTHDGDSAYMVLQAGDNEMSITSDVTTTGTVEVEFYAAYL